MEKPLLRWIVGPVNKAGFGVLAESVRQMKRIYGSRFDLMICHNQLDEMRIRMVEKLGCEIYEQSPEDFHIPPVVWEGDYAIETLSEQPTRACWKLYPPRMRLNSHEIIMDNDVVLLRPIPQIEEFLQRRDACLLTEAVGRNYGSFEPIIPDIKLNNGVIGLPPGYDFSGSLRRLCRILRGRWGSYFDDQGIVAATMCRKPLIVIPRSELEFGFHTMSLPNSRNGYHFVGVNFMERSIAWEDYCNKKMTMI